MLAAGTKLSGVNFNRLYSDTKFYKFLNDDLIHNKFTYAVGLIPNRLILMENVRQVVCISARNRSVICSGMHMDLS